jgi:hypothetical protein
MNKQPGRYDITLRAASDDGRPLPDPATFAAVASRTASSMNAGVICVVRVAAPDRPSAVAVALAVVAGTLKAAIGSGHPAGERPVPAIMRRFEEHRLPELVVAAVAHDSDVSHPAATAHPGDRPRPKKQARTGAAPTDIPLFRRSIVSRSMSSRLNS